ncbi:MULTISPECIES: TetR/AcrR family transcriptional regulator [Brachybacterium]|uniref:TetR/AcrR family transcriptional regulator n=1 Tax=Brachybacterium TaxID=43668 RepID=UPI0006C6D623|nr:MULTISPECIES: TetR/AcrR family transcriptional regulator [Brachybacterium]GAP80049.1 transcriptional regulator, TetR family [Brachybacterium sp. SW0106-09]
MDERRKSTDGAADAAGHAGREQSSRERILAAAAAIIAESGVTARLSVRAVAARAGVSAGSLRHHFPSQQALRDEVMRRIYDWMMPEVDLHDTAVPARDRLMACLRGVLDLAGTGPEARAATGRLVSTFVTVEPTAEVREAYLAMRRDGRRRTEGWLHQLAEEGALAVADVPRTARFLETVLDGLALERALPADDAQAEVETEVLRTVVDAVLTVDSPRPQAP